MCHRCHNDMWSRFRTWLEQRRRLCPSGSGAKSCFADAKRGGQDGVEGRSREEGRVSPGKAEAVLRNAIACVSGALEDELEWVERFRSQNRRQHAKRSSQMADHHRDTIRFLESLLPEPDSKIAKQASGRRNAKSEP